MQRKKSLYILILVLSLVMLSINAVYAQDGSEGAAPPAFTGTVFALSFAFVLGLGGIILYGSSKGDADQKKGKTTKTVTAKNKDVYTNKTITANQEKKKLRKQLLDGKIDEQTYLEEVNKLK